VRPSLLVSALLAAALIAEGPRALADDAACIAASEQSLTLRQQGKLHDALKQLALCADASCPDEVKQECSHRIDAIGAAMPSLVFVAKDGSGNDLSDVTLTMDGALLATKLDGEPLSIDPGEHTFRLETGGQPAVEKKLVLREGERGRRESVVIGPPQAVVPQLPPSPAVALPPRAPSSWSTRRTLAVVSAGIGVVGVGLGAAFGVYASSSQNRERSDCSSLACTNYPQALEDYDTAKKDATGSTIAFVAGAAFLAAGALLWLTAPGEPAVSPAGARSLRLALASVGAGGGFVVGGDL
jgi:hypothetical protein